MNKRKKLKNKKEDFNKLIFQVNFENQDKDYQFSLNDYEAVNNKNEVVLNFLHNER